MQTPADGMNPIPSTDFDRPVHALMGLPFDAVTLAQAVTQLRACMDHRIPCCWATPNVNFVATAAANPAFRASVLRTDFSTADGMPLIWLAAWMGIPLPERVAGSDAFDQLHQPRADGRVNTVFLFGGDDGVAETAHQALNAHTDGQAVGFASVGFIAPGRGPASALSRPAYLDAIRQAKPDFLLISLGAVKGHEWIDLNWPALDVPVVSHLGAVLNFHAKTVKRAPRWMQATGLEWVWRILAEPGLWRRYWSDGKTLAQLVWTCALPYRRARRHWLGTAGTQTPAGSAAWHTADGHTQVTLAGVLHTHNLGPLRQCLQQATTQPSAISIDCSQLKWLDSAAMGLLLLLAGHQIKLGQAYTFQGMSNELRAAFESHGCGYLLG